MRSVERSSDTILQYLLGISRYNKRILLIVTDAVLCVLSLWGAYALRLTDWYPSYFIRGGLSLFVLLPLLGFAIFWMLGLYKTVIRYMSSNTITDIAKGVLFLGIACFALSSLLNVAPFPRTVPILFALLLFVGVGGVRLVIKGLHRMAIGHRSQRDAVLIYGAGGAGTQLLSAIRASEEYYPLGYLDDDRSLIRGRVSGLRVFAQRDIQRLIDREGLTTIILALPNITAARRAEILEELSEYPVHVLTVPSMTELFAGDSLGHLRDVEVQDLLARTVVPPMTELLEEGLKQRSVMVTGAGGSIGSEICRQVIACKPARLLLFELSEFALYQIEQEISSIAAKHNVELVALLGNCTEKAYVADVISGYEVDTIFHAAAYKHVPIVETNIYQGVENNIFGTLAVAQAAQECEVERMILVSTDKAVRPTNVMGATKRVAEQLLQALNKECTTTCFSIVRFGNVLGSSGSVVPLFKKQILAGGPVTVTHPEITRYFMTIPEAALLVVHASCIARGGEVFVLDMGQPVSIFDMAKRMIHLMGKRYSAEDREAGISIQFTGLRPGEKLHEELIIGESVEGTQHPKIMLARETYLSFEMLQDRVLQLRESARNGEFSRVYSLFEELVDGYHRSEPRKAASKSARPEGRLH